jgi:CheY-like chemotaxis protein
MVTKTVLHVDDEPSARTALKRQLRRSRFVVAEAGEGREALELMQHFCFDVAVVDIAMPGINGFELIQT